MYRGIAAAALAMAGTMAAAACPQAGDLAEGIHVGYDDDSVTRYYSTVPGEVIEDTLFTDGSGSRFVVATLSGLFELSFLNVPGGDPDQQSREVTEYASDLRSELPLRAGQRIGTTATTTYADGGTLREAYSVEVGAAPDIAIGDCRYAALEVRHIFTSTEGVFGILQRYLPELGIAIYDGTTASSGAEPVSYQALWISDRAR